MSKYELFHLDQSEERIRETVKNMIGSLAPIRQEYVAKAILHDAQENIKEERNAKARERYRLKREKQLLASKQNNMFVKLSLSPGDLIKVTNTQDGHGIRKVQKVVGDKVFCYQMYDPVVTLIPSWMNWGKPSLVPAKKDTPYSQYCVAGRVTRHNLSSVSHIVENDNLVKISL